MISILPTTYYNDLPASSKSYDHTTLLQQQNFKYLVTDNLQIRANNVFYYNQQILTFNIENKNAILYY
jgi:hypothetical protein